MRDRRQTRYMGKDDKRLRGRRKYIKMPHTMKTENDLVKAI